MAELPEPNVISRSVTVLPRSTASGKAAAARGPLKRSREQYEKAWRPVDSRIQTALAHQKDSSVEEIAAWVAGDEKSSVATMFESLVNKTLLPTALIIGAHRGSSGILWQSLTGALSNNDSTTTVVQLSSKECSTVRKAMRTLVQSFVGQDMHDPRNAEDSDDEGYDLEQRSPRKPARNKASRVSLEDFSHVAKWYEHLTQRGKAPAKLVLVLEDLESMEGRVLEPIIRTLSSYADRLPLVLLIGIATTGNSFYGMIPRKTVLDMRISTFVVDAGSSALLGLFKELLHDWPSSVSLSPEVWSDLWMSFKQMHRSIDATISALQYLFILHSKHERKGQASGEWERGVYDALQAFSSLQQKYTPGHTFEKSLQDWLEGSFGDRLDALTGAIKRSSSGKLLECLPDWAAAFKDMVVSDISIDHQLSHYHRQLQGLDAQRKPGQQNLNNPFAAGLDTEGLPRLDRDFATLIEDIVELVQDAISVHLVDETTFQDVDQSSVIKDTKRLGPAFHPCVGDDLVKALLDDNDQDDTMIAFRLLKDAGRVVNLSDWYEAFKGAVVSTVPNDQGDGEKRRSSRRSASALVDRDDDEVQDRDEEQDQTPAARFLMAVAELIRYGFVSGSTRKLEHVNREWF